MFCFIIFGGKNTPYSRSKSFLDWTTRNVMITLAKLKISEFVSRL